MSVPVGAVVSERYEIVRPLASGGMGAVYVARHTVTLAEVALKVIHSELLQSDVARERFFREARVAANVGHSGIVRVHDAGNDAQHGAWLAMDLLRGEDLSRRISRLSPPPSSLVPIVLALLAPLEAAHAHGFVHRDIKPENVFLARRGADREVVRLLDFGVSRQLGARSATADFACVGTIYYMSPEQVRNARTVTPAADVWSVGVMLYELISGVSPFDGKSVQEIAVRICTQKPVDLRELVPGLAPSFCELVMRCMTVDASLRPADAGALATELRALLALDEVQRSIDALPSPRAAETPSDVADVSADPTTLRSAIEPALKLETEIEPTRRRSHVSPSMPPPAAIVSMAPSVPLPVARKGAPVKRLAAAAVLSVLAGVVPVVWMSRTHAARTVAPATTVNATPERAPVVPATTAAPVVLEAARPATTESAVVNTRMTVSPRAPEARRPATTAPRSSMVRAPTVTTTPAVVEPQPAVQAPVVQPTRVETAPAVVRAPVAPTVTPTVVARPVTRPPVVAQPPDENTAPVSF